MGSYYNEFDPNAAAWIRQLIKNGDIADGVVDERSITEVEPADLAGFERVHFFAGIGTWDYCLTNAGWSGNVWTASLPCQPFSIAGKQQGKEDERHLLPHFIELVRQCQPDVIFGEQVAAAIRHGWLDDLYTEMERENYTVGAAVLGAHSVNAPHQRQRIYWVASGTVADTSSEGLQGHRRPKRFDDSQGWKEPMRHGAKGCVDSRMGDTEHNGHASSEKQGSNGTSIQCSEKRTNSTGESQGASTPRIVPSELIEWLYCRDEKYRPIKSGIKPLVDGASRGVVHSINSIITPNASSEARAIRIKGYGNAIVAPVAEEFIRSFMDS